jgi:hypothetical protein
MLTLTDRRAAHIHEVVYASARQAVCFYSCLKSFKCWLMHIAQTVGHTVGCELSSLTIVHVLFSPFYDYEDVALLPSRPDDIDDVVPGFDELGIEMSHGSYHRIHQAMEEPCRSL